jgi:signal transduction histidine kinase
MGLDSEASKMNVDSAASRLDSPAWKDEVPSRSDLDLKRHIAHLHTLREIGRKLNSKLDLEDVLANILDEAIRAIGAERGCLLLTNAVTGELETCLCRYLESSDRGCDSFRPSQTVIERVWSEGEPVLTANALEDPELAQADSVINYTLRSILCVPLHLQEQKIGVLYLDNRFKSGQFEEDDLALISAVADQAAVALYNAQLYQQAVHRASTLSRLLELVQTLNQISSKAQGLMDLSQLLDVVGKRLEELGGYSAVLLLEPDKQFLDVAYVSPSFITPGQGRSQGNGMAPHPAIRVVPGSICHNVIQNREPHTVPQLSSVVNEVLPEWRVEDTTPGMVAPLIAKDEVIGLLLMALPDIGEQGLMLITAFANQIAGAIQSARLLREAETRLAERQSILAVTRALVTEVSLPTLLEFIMVQAQYLANAEGAAVFLFSDDGNFLEQRISVNSPPPVAGIRFPVEGSLAGMAVATGHTQVSNEASTDPRTVALREGIKPANLHSLLQAPLFVRGKALGTLAVCNKRDDVFTPDDVRLMGLFADQAALAIHNAQILAHERELAALRERHRLARDIHDSVIQSLYSITLAARTALLAPDQTSGEARAPMKYVIELAQGAMAEMRGFISDLRPAYLTERGLVNALSDQATVLRQHYGMSVEFEADKEPSLSREQKEALYLIAREAIHNVVKHASAQWVKISLTTRDSQVTLCVEDDGHGFDPEATAGHETMGLTSMMERTALSGASLSVVSAPNEGVRLTVTIP